MRKLTFREYTIYDCEFCGDCVNRQCPHETCLYKKIEQPKRIPKKIYKPRVKIAIDETAPRVISDNERNKMFPRKSVFERYDVKRIVFMHIKGYMAVDIAGKMHLRPQEVGEVIRQYKKGELDAIL